jgi:hypothetical protein
MDIERALDGRGAAMAGGRWSGRVSARGLMSARHIWIFEYTEPRPDETIALGWCGFAFASLPPIGAEFLRRLEPGEKASVCHPSVTACARLMV